MPKLILNYHKKVILVLPGQLSVYAYLDCDQREITRQVNASQLKHVVDKERQCPIEGFRSDTT